MKRLLQIVLRPVAALIVGLVAMQPAIVGLLCRAPAAPCPLAFTDTTPHCGALSKGDLDGSRPRTSVHAAPRSMASVALPAARKALVLVGAEAPAEALPVPAAIPFIEAQPAARAESPPIYLRNRVFRI